MIYGIFNRDFFEISVENSTLNKDSTFNRTVRLIESTEYWIAITEENRRRKEKINTYLKKFGFISFVFLEMIYLPIAE